MKIIIPLFILFFTASFLNALDKSDSTKTKNSREKFDPDRDAAEDIEEAVAAALKSGKRILLDVGGEWCIWCHYLDKFIEENKDVQEFISRNFEVVKVNFSPENRNEKVLSKYPEIPGYPHLFVLDSNGKFLHSQGTAELEEGRGYDKNKVMAFLKRWAPSKLK